MSALLSCSLVTASACGWLGIEMLPFVPDAMVEVEDAHPGEFFVDASSASDGGGPDVDAGFLGVDGGPNHSVDGGRVPADVGPSEDGGPADSGEEDSGREVDAETEPEPDACPADPDKVEPGLCGCGIPENCQQLKVGLVHRYRFDETGSAFADSVSGADGTTTANLSGSGELVMSGGQQYATLPSQIVSKHSAATIEFWLTWLGGTRGQRVISFGTATPGSLDSVTCNGGSYCTGTTAKYHQGSWYRFCTARTCTWEDAAAGCRSAGAHLLAIDSAQEQQYFETHPEWSDVSLWLGGNDRGTQGQWYWSSAESDQGGSRFWSGHANGSPMAGAYTNWDVNEPSSASGNDCAFLYKSTMKWWAWSCDGWGGHAVCEWSGHQGTSIDSGVWFTPSNDRERPSLHYKASGTTSTAAASSAFPVGTPTHVALVLNPGQGSIALYVNGSLAASASSTAPLSTLRDGDNWLGRSHVRGDPGLNGAISELRIYGRALSADEIRTSAQAGPDPSFL